MASQPTTDPGRPSERDEILADWVIERAGIKTVSAHVADADREWCRLLVIAYLEGSVKLPALEKAIKETFGVCNACKLLKTVLEMEPGPVNFVNPCEPKWNGRKKRRYWSESEDLRLIAAVYRFGTQNWPQISKFVGNGRSRNHCNNRWNRSLSPKVSKADWTDEELKKLMELTKSGIYPSWGAIARKIGTRSDLQCRFKYNQMMRAESQKPATVEPPKEMSADSSSNRPKLTIPRFLMPTSGSGLEEMSSDKTLTCFDTVPSDLEMDMF